MQTGNLVVRPYKADLRRNLDLFSKMDPYCVVIVGGQKYKTRVHTRGGKHPMWQDQFIFRRSTETEIRFEVWDFDKYSNDDLVGEGKLQLQQVIRSRFDDWVELTYKHGKRAGKVRVSIVWRPDFAQQSGPYLVPNLSM
mmetsp:Transcript_3532/g.5443  ORF Transcript_3532/g.5443 Transcript_3532/m.5443 type:complete len:139 (-) Transcript_3532:586-1002(-)